MLTKVTLGNTDLQVSQFCYGTNMLGSALDQGRSNEILDTFASLGGNFLDTARMYGDWIPDGPKGASERAIGGWLKSRSRDGLVISTKGGGMDLRAGDWANRCNPAGVAQDLAESLEHLGIDSIDLYWLHADNPEAPVEIIVDALLEHQAAGTIRHFGASNWAPDRIRAANTHATSLGKSGFVASETFWGLAVPDVDVANMQGYVLYYEGLYEELHATGLPVLAYGAQSGGYFTKLASGGIDSVREDIRTRYDNPANAGRARAVQQVAAKQGVSINEVVLSYLASQPNQTIPIFGGSSPEQVVESVKAAALKLSAEELAQLRAG